VDRGRRRGSRPLRASAPREQRHRRDGAHVPAGLHRLATPGGHDLGTTRSGSGTPAGWHAGGVGDQLVGRGAAHGAGRSGVSALASTSTSSEVGGVVTVSARENSDAGIPTSSAMGSVRVVVCEQRDRTAAGAG
jgi:hypothetical protein